MLRKLETGDTQETRDNRFSGGRRTEMLRKLETGDTQKVVEGFL